jgi:class 3 adenylate cyclase
MFCDLAGSTELFSRLDPADLRQVILAYQVRVRDAMAKYSASSPAMLVMVC